MLLGIPVPIWVAAVLVLATYVVVNWTPLGRHFYAVGGNPKAAQLSGINTRQDALHHLRVWSACSPRSPACC